MDTVDANFKHEWLDNLEQALGGRKPDYLIVQHMEPDHAANVANFLEVYPGTTVVANAKTFVMIKNFFGLDLEGQKLEVENGSTLSLGNHNLTFVFAPMVHWPEVMVTYDSTDKVLFSADGFGKFGALDVTSANDWTDEARRYYFGIVGKFGANVQAVLKKAANLEIQKICPLHGPVLDSNLEKYIQYYDTWSKYEAETDGIFIAYTSVYGNTKQAAEKLAEILKEKGCKNVLIKDLARNDIFECVADAFRYKKLVLASTTYNTEVFPKMREFIAHLVERNFQNRTVGFIENCSWAPLAAKTMAKMFEPLKEIKILEEKVTIKIAVNEEVEKQLENFAEKLI